MTIENIIAYQRAWKEFAETPVGKAFVKFESATVRYWQADGNENLSTKRLRELDEAMRTARKEFVLLIGGPNV